MRKIFLWFSSGCMHAPSTRATVLGWRFAKKLSRVMAAEFGWKDRWARAPLSSSPCRQLRRTRARRGWNLWEWVNERVSERVNEPANEQANERFRAGSN